MKKIFMTALLLGMALSGLDAYAQTEVNTLSQINGLEVGTEVKVNLNDVHTTLFCYDYWQDANLLYMQDATAGIIFSNIKDFAAEKTLNGTILAKVASVNGMNGLTVDGDKTTADNVTVTDWSYTGVSATIPGIEAGNFTSQLVTLKNVTSTPSSYSSYAVTISDGANTIELYNDFDYINLNLVPEKISSLTALVMLDYWNGGYYLVPLRQDLIVDADAPDDAVLVKKLSDLSSCHEGDVVKVNLANVHTSATMTAGGVTSVYLEDATAGTVFTGLEGIGEFQTLNGDIYAMVKQIGSDMCLTYNAEKTNLSNVTITSWTPVGSTCMLNGARSSYWHNRLVTLTNLKSEKTADATWTLSQDEVTMTMTDAFGKLAGYDVPTNIKSLTAVVRYDAAAEAYQLAPIGQDYIIEDVKVEPDTYTTVDNIGDIKNLTAGTVVKLNLTDAHTTYYCYDWNTYSQVLYLQDASGATAFIGVTDVASAKTWNGWVYARTQNFNGDVCLAVDDSYTTLDNVTVTDWTLAGTLTSLADVEEGKATNALVKLENCKSLKDDSSSYGYYISQGASMVYMYDENCILTGYELPETLASIVVLVKKNAYSGEIELMPISRDLIEEGSEDETPIEVNTIAACKTLNDGQNFALNVTDAIVTIAFENPATDDTEESATYIIEDATGGMILRGFPLFFEWEVGDVVNGTLYGRMSQAGYTDAIADGSPDSYYSQIHLSNGEVKPTKVTVAEALTKRWHNCYVELSDVNRTTGTMSFYGEEYEYPALNDGTGTILFEDGWEILGNWTLPDHLDAIRGHVEPFFGAIFLYPSCIDDVLITSVESIVTGAQYGSDEIYNLSGQRVNHRTIASGLYVVGGKKVLVK